MDERIASLSNDLKSFGKEIVDYVGARHSVCTSLITIRDQNVNFNLKTDPRNAIPVLRGDLNELLIESNSSNASGLQEMNNQLRLLENISNLCEGLTKGEELVNKYDLKSATKLVRSLESTLSATSSIINSTNANAADGIVFTTLIKELKFFKYNLQSTIRRLILNSVQVELGKVTVLKSLKGFVRSEDNYIDTPLDLSGLWQAMIDVGGVASDQSATNSFLQTLINDILEIIWLNILKPLWREKKFSPSKAINDESIVFSYDTISRERTTAENVNDINRQALGSPSHSATTAVSSGNAACKMHPAQLLDSVSQVIHFIWTELFCGIAGLNDSVCKGFNASPISLMQTLHNTLLHAMPKVEADVVPFQRSLDKPTREFEIKCKQFLPANTTNGLVKLVEDLPNIFADTKRKEILSRARELVISDYHNTMVSFPVALLPCLKPYVQSWVLEMQTKMILHLLVTLATLALCLSKAAYLVCKPCTLTLVPSPLLLAEFLSS